MPLIYSSYSCIFVRFARYSLCHWMRLYLISCILLMYLIMRAFFYPILIQRRRFIFAYSTESFTFPNHTQKSIEIQTKETKAQIRVYLVPAIGPLQLNLRAKTYPIKKLGYKLRFEDDGENYRRRFHKSTSVTANSIKGAQSQLGTRISSRGTSSLGTKRR